jgi:hypothetical protein
MVTYLEKIQYLYPGIQKVMQWDANFDGTPFNDPYDGVVWENTEYDKPSKEVLDAIPDEDIIASQKEKELNALCDSLKNDTMAKMMYMMEKKSNADLTFKDYIKSIQDMEVV